MERKSRALAVLRERLSGARDALCAVDARLAVYMDGVARDVDDHNLYEVLGCVRWLRLLSWYALDVSLCRRLIRVIEGEWRDGRHVRGGLRFEGMVGLTYYRLTPFQVWELVSLFGLYCLVPLRAHDGGVLSPTEVVHGDTVYDRRRLITEFTLFVPRKTAKTWFAAVVVELFFMLVGDYNAELYCTANSQDQSRILFQKVKGLLQQLDPQGKRIRFTATEVNWKVGQPRACSVSALSAGGKTKDGLFAQLCCADEFGSAYYVKNHSDMADLVNVVTGSMGPRREPLLLITTTAGNSIEGPFQTRLDGLKRLMRDELSLSTAPVSGIRSVLREQLDRTFAIVMEPDEWQKDEEIILNADVHLVRKVNPHVGVTVQPDFYERELALSRIDPEKRKETLTKLFNVFRSEAVTEWITAEEVRRLQVPMRIDDCVESAGWVVYGAFDFSLGNDLHASGYLAARDNGRGSTELFYDIDAWITEEMLSTHTLSNLYAQWVEQGWLKVSPGKTLQAALPINRVIELHNKGVNFIQFGYDIYKAKEPINALKAWVWSMGVDPEQVVVPVRQNYATYNPAVLEVDYCVKSDPALLHFSENPLLPWEFSNCVLSVSADGMDNKKPVKRTANGKVDHVQTLCSCFVLMDAVEGRVN